jgi:hypothetical protein
VCERSAVAVSAAESSEEDYRYPDCWVQQRKADGRRAEARDM